MLVSGEFQTSFLIFLFFFFLQTSLSPCAFLTPFPRNPYVSSQVLELVAAPTSDYLVHIAEPTSVFFLTMGHFPCHIPKQLKELTPVLGIHSTDVCICVFFSNAKVTWRSQDSVLGLFLCVCLSLASPGLKVSNTTLMSVDSQFIFPAWTSLFHSRQCPPLPTCYSHQDVVADRRDSVALLMMTSSLSGISQKVCFSLMYPSRSALCHHSDLADAAAPTWNIADHNFRENRKTWQTINWFFWNFCSYFMGQIKCYGQSWQQWSMGEIEQTFVAISVYQRCPMTSSTLLIPNWTPSSTQPTLLTCLPLSLCWFSTSSYSGQKLGCHSWFLCFISHS